MVGYINGKKFLSALEAAKRFGYTSDYVTKLAREGKVVARKIDREWFVDSDSLLAFIADAKKKELDRREALKRERVQEYHTPRPTVQAAAAPHASSGALFAKAFAVALSATVFFISFSAASGFIAAQPLKKLSSVFAGTHDGSGVHADTADAVHTLTSSVRDALRIDRNEIGVRTYATFAAFPGWYDRFTDELALIWVERGDIVKEIGASALSTPVPA